MLLKAALLLSMLIQLGATIIAISLIRRTRFNISWILISAGFVLMAVRRLFDFSTLFWESQLFPKENVNSWLGVLISLLMFIGVIFIRQIFNLQERIDQIRKDSETKVLSAVLHAEEKARQTFARDLHDGLGPILSAIKMTMSAIDLQKLDLPNRQIIGKTCSATDEAIISLKEISNHLSPHLLKNYGLTNAIETFATRLLSNSGITFDMNSKILEKRFQYNLEISLYRIISELLNNSLKHGQPTQISLDIFEDDNSLLLKYQDDGCGFDPKENVANPESQGMGMGMENIRSRIKSLNGELHLKTAPNKGLSIDIYIPVA